MNTICLATRRYFTGTLLALAAGCASAPEHVNPAATVPCPELPKPVATTAPAIPEIFQHNADEHILKGGANDQYRIVLQTGEFVRIQVKQMGIDVVLTSFSPANEKLKEIDSPNGTEGFESVEIVATAAGTYRIEVASPEANVEPGRYTIEISNKLSPQEYQRYSTVDLPLEQLSPLVGTYEVAPGRRIIMGLSDELGLQMMALDTQTRGIELLHAHSATEFFSGPSLLDKLPPTTDYTFRKGAGGEVTSLEIRAGKTEPLVARRISPARSEDITFKNGDLTLKGTLLVPEGKGPHPAIVYAHGSGDRTRHAAFYNAYFAQLGFAVYSFDKRGVGESSGNWRTAGFDELANDVLESVLMLQKRPDIDPQRVGVFGISQGGWIGSLAAQSPNVKFFVSIVGSGVTVWENVAHESETLMRDAGLAGPTLETGITFAKRIYKMAADGETYDKVLAVVNQHRGQDYVKYV
ncbi:MAG TPA: alpha/beta fold hydrolase, partial [Polyangium sp.]|nr:alpha/beta fold hydrolase [Polyangium sp.]